MLEEREDTPRTKEVQSSYSEANSGTSSTRRATLRKVFINKWSVRIYAFVIFIVIWQIIGETQNPIIFSPPAVVAKRFIQLTADSTIPSATLLTLQTVVFGFIPAVVIGIPIGLLIGRSKTTEYALDPYVSFIYAIPIIVMIPILIVWFGSNLFSSYILVFIAGVFPVVINSISGAKNVSETLVETGHSFGFRGTSLWRKIIFPGSLPYVMAGLRIGVGHAVIGAILAEIFMDTVGLGFLIEDGASLFDTPEVISAVIVTIFLGIFLTELVKVFERRVSMWSAAEGNQ
jgi:ABC-type nitrate/sulfonate/bicarbonate transport system permease component